MNNRTTTERFLDNENSKGSNLISNNGILISYYSVLAKKFGDIVVISRDTKNYSNTSKRHAYHLEEALYYRTNIKKIEVEDFDENITLKENLKRNYKRKWEELKNLIKKHERAYKKSYKNEIMETIKEIEIILSYNKNYIKNTKKMALLDFYKSISY